MNNLHFRNIDTFEWECEEYIEELDDFDTVQKSCEFEWDVEIDIEWGRKNYSFDINYISGDDIDQDVEEQIIEMLLENLA